MKRIIFSCLLYFLWNLAFSQDRKKDSLSGIVYGNYPDSVVCKAFNELTKLYIKEQDTVSFKKTIIEFEKKLINSESSVIGNYYYLARSNYEDEITQNVDRQMEYLMKSRDYALKSGDKISAAKRTQKVARIYVYQGNYAIAAREYLKAIKWNEESGNEIGRSYNYMGLAEVFRLQNNKKKALEMFRMGYQIAILLHDEVGISAGLNNIGMMHHSLGDLDSALYYFHKAVELNFIRNKEREIAGTLDRIASIYSEKKEPLKALEILQKSLAIKIKGNDKTELAITYINFADNYHELNQFENAEKYLDMALQIAGEMKLIKFTEHCFKIKALMYKDWKKFDKSAEYFVKYNLLHDSLITDQINKNVAELEEKYENEKSRKEIEVLNKDKIIQASDIQKQRQFINFIVLISFLLMVLLFFIFKGYKRKKKDNLELINKNSIIEEQKMILEEKNNEITASINYAKRIQNAILPPNRIVKEYLPESFILYKPKDIVAGDFFWLEHKNGVTLFAAADCTGHGVPGAMVSVICNNGLNRSVREHGLTDPGEILNKTREIVIQEFEKSDEEVKDGMDISLCALDGKILKWAGANNPIWIVKNNSNEIFEIKANKQPIGKYAENNSFTTHTIELESGDSIYIFTDGFQDQFGGEQGKKFKASKFKELILSIQKKTMSLQRIAINEAFENWQGNLEQVDDVCVIGMKCL